LKPASVGHLFPKLLDSRIPFLLYLHFPITLADRETQIEMDPPRTIVHNALIDCINILARNMSATGENVEWHGLFRGDRHEIGKFACWVHWYLSDGA